MDCLPSRYGLQRDPIDEFQFYIGYEKDLTQQIVCLDCDCIEKLRSDFENDVALDFKEFIGIKAELIKGADGQKDLSIACFDHFIAKWDSSLILFDLTSTKIIFSDKYAVFSARLLESQKSFESQAAKLISQHQPEKVDWSPPT